MPYMNFYIRSLKDCGHELHILSWKRDKQPDDEAPKGIKHHEFYRPLDDEILKIKKIPAFAAYRKLLIKLIKKEKFDFFICLHTLPGVLVYRRLCGEYKNRFILDYRDFTFENIRFYAKIIEKLAKASKLTFVSSGGFRRYLPDIPDILPSHNINPEEANLGSSQKHDASENGKIRISFWGYIRHERVNIRIIDSLRGDGRFELHYYGREQQTARRLKEYCGKVSAENVFFHGPYSPPDRRVIAEKTDMIHNVYDGGSTEEIAVGNKYYDSLLFCLPQICAKGSYMGALAERDGVGISLDPYGEGFADALWEYYNSIDRDAFVKACGKRLIEITDEYENGAKAVREAVSS